MPQMSRSRSEQGGTSKGWGQEDPKSSKVDVPERNRVEQDRDRIKKMKKKLEVSRSGVE